MNLIFAITGLCPESRIKKALDDTELNELNPNGNALENIENPANLGEPDCLRFLEEINSAILDRMPDTDHARTLAASMLPCLRHRAWKVRKKSAEVISLFGDNVMDLVVPHLTSPDRDLAFWASRVVASFGDSGVTQLGQLLDDPDPERRLYVINALRESSSRKGAPYLIKALADPQWSNRKVAAEALESLGKSMVPLLLKAFNRLNEDVKFWSIRVVGKLTGSEGVASLKKILASKDQNLRYYAVLALGEIPCTESVQSLVDALSDKTWIIRKLAADMLKKIGKPAIPVLKESLQAEDPDIRYWATRLLGRIMKSRAIPILADLLASNDDNTRHFALLAMGETGSAKAVPHLIRCFSDPSWMIREQAAELISRAGEKAIPTLKKAAKAGDMDTRFWAIRILSAMGFKYLDFMVTDFSEQDSRVRLYFLSSLKPERNRKLVTFLIDCLADPSWPVRNKSAELLTKIGPGAIPRLELAAAEGDADKGFWASRVIDKIRQTAMKPLEKALGDFNIRAVRKAVNTVARKFRKINERAVARQVVELLFKHTDIYCRELTRLVALFSDEAVDEAIATVRRSGHINRKWVYLGLGRNRDPKCLPILLEALNHDMMCRTQILEALSMKESPKALDILVTELFNTTEEPTREKIAAFLGENCLSRARARLYREYQTATAGEIRWIEMVGEAAARTNLTEILSLLSREPLAENRIFFKPLRGVADPRKIPPLVKLLDPSDKALFREILMTVRNVPDTTLIIKLLEFIEEGRITSDEDLKPVLDAFESYQHPEQIAETLELISPKPEAVNNWYLKMQKKGSGAWMTEDDSPIPVPISRPAFRIPAAAMEANIADGLGPDLAPGQSRPDSGEHKVIPPTVSKLGVITRPEDEIQALLAYSTEEIASIPYFRIVKVLGNAMRLPYGEIQSLARVAGIEEVIAAVRDLLKQGMAESQSERLRALRQKLIQMKRK